MRVAQSETNAQPHGRAADHAGAGFGKSARPIAASIYWKDDRRFANCLPFVPPTRENDGPAPASREQLIAEHLPRVQLIARSMHKRLPPHVLYEDLCSAGFIGLLDALDKFIPSDKAQFRSYAHFRIRGAIMDSLREIDWGPRRLRRITREIKRAEVKLAEELGRDPTDVEVADALKIDLKSLLKTRCELRGLEIDWMKSENMASIEASSDDDPLFRVLGAELRHRMNAAVANLSEHQRDAFRLYYFEERKQKEIAILFGVTESRISQILASAVSQIRVQLEAYLSANRPVVEGVNAR
jgi:RNA polymerase sigma factor for flagellar operon FliA